MNGIRPGLSGMVGLAVAALTMASCGSGAPGSGPEGPGFRPEIARCETPSANTVYLCRNADLSTEETVAVDLMVSSETAVFGMAADLTFDPANVSLVRKTDQTLDYALPERTVWKRTFVNLQQGREDRLILGVSRKKGDLPITGNVPLVTLKFRVLSGESPVTFSNNRLLGEGGLPVEGGPYHWYGGFLIEGNGNVSDVSAGRRTGGDGKLDIPPSKTGDMMSGKLDTGRAVEG